MLAKRRLGEHPTSDRSGIDAVGAKLFVEDDGRWRVEFVVLGAMDTLVIPEPGAGVRRDGLWEHMCCEIFVAGAGAGYVEVNLSPSGDWAAYAFDRYRDGMRDVAGFAAPGIVADRADHRFQLTAFLDPSVLGVSPHQPSCVSLSIVLEHVGGRKSYWALKHQGGPPDFHNRDCFTLELAAPSGP